MKAIKTVGSIKPKLAFLKKEADVLKNDNCKLRIQTIRNNIMRPLDVSLNWLSKMNLTSQSYEEINSVIFDVKEIVNKLEVADISDDERIKRMLTVLSFSTEVDKYVVTLMSKDRDQK